MIAPFFETLFSECCSQAAAVDEANGNKVKLTFCGSRTGIFDVTILEKQYLKKVSNNTFYKIYF